MDTQNVKRRLPIGAEVVAGGAHFRVWAPRRRRVSVVIEGGGAEVELSAEPSGYFSAFGAGVLPGARYRFRLDSEAELYPDPASRCQPEGPHGASEVIDPGSFRWSDEGWGGSELHGQVIYEMHLGTFTQEGTWEAASRQLAALAETGITLIEVMPVHEFPGRFGWGYDGVALYAPSRLYGTPEDMRRFVDEAHRQGVGVILDVVYNHFGPDGNYLRQFSDAYFTDRYKTDWGDPINFDGEGSTPVREFFVSNAGYWVDEFHFDGLRIDATQAIFDASAEHVLCEITARVRHAARGRKTVVVGENEPQDVTLLKTRDAGGYCLEALWNDDFHHSAIVALTGRNEAYYTDYLGKAQEFISALKWGFLYQGQRYRWQKKRRGTPSLDMKAERFVLFLENHDQVANSGRGARLSSLTSPGEMRAMTALLLLSPGTPMLFQGQEFGSSKPFYYFADHNAELNALIKNGRGEFLSQFRSLATPDAQHILTDPGDPAVFEACKLDFGERERNAHVLRLHSALLRLRREDPVFRAQDASRMYGAVLSERAFVLRFFGEGGEGRLLVVNFGGDLLLDPAPEPLLAPPAGMVWTTLFSTEDPAYGGNGTPALDSERNWSIPGRASVVLVPTPAPDPESGEPGSSPAKESDA